MMSFFKKETKEDKERKKLEKKHHHLNHIDHHSISRPPTTPSDNILNQSNEDLFLLNTTTSTSDTMNTSNSNNNNKLKPSKLYNLNNSTSTDSSSLNASTTTTTRLSIDLAAAGSTAPPLPPKPKKGILKTMSKFTIGGATPILSSTSPSLPSRSHKPPPPAAAAAAASSSIETSILNYSKRNSQFLADPQQQQVKSQEAPPTTTTTTTSSSSLSFVLPQLKYIPFYLSRQHMTPDYLNTTSGRLLIRNISIPPDLIESIELRNDPDMPSVVLISSNKSSLLFLPNDQLIAINDQLITDKYLNEIKQILNEHRTYEDNGVCVVKVRTCLQISELILRNRCDGSLGRNTHHLSLSLDLNEQEIRSLKRAGSLKRIKLKSLSSSSTSSISSSVTTPSSSVSSLNNNNNSPTSSSESAESSADSSSNNLCWLMHLNGYTSAKIFAKIIHKQNDADSSSSSSSSSQNIKFKIRLENGNLIEVNEENLEKANPSPQYDMCEDLSHLRFINETSLIHVIRQRLFTLKLIHTYVNNQSMIIMRPPVSIKASSSKGIYDDRIISMFKGCKQEDMPPHIYSYTQSVYKTMLTTRQDQSILLMGHSGSGKSFNSKYALNYLFKVATSASSLSSNNFTEAKLNAMYCLLNAFCSIRTSRNLSGANRFLNLFLLEFNYSGQLASILLQTITFDGTRLVYQPNNESNYLIFYNLLFGSTQANLSYKNDLQLNTVLNETFVLNNTDSGNLFFQSIEDLKKQLESNSIETHRKCFEAIMDAFGVLGFDANEVKSIFLILAAVLHLGRAGACKIQQQQQQQQQQTTQQRLGQFKSANDAHKAANLLGISFNQLNDCVFCCLNNSASNTNNANKFSHLSNHGSSRASPDPHLSTNMTPIECLQGFCIGLYQECINLITNCINRSFKPISGPLNQSISNSMLIIDPPGFQYQLINQKTQPASTSMPQYCSHADLMCNYLSERLKLMFFQITFINPIEKCAQEGLDIDLVEHIPESPSSLVNWLDKPPVQTVNQSLNNYGLLWILEDQMNQSDVKTFLKRLIDSDQRQNFITTFKNDSINNTNFIIHHEYGQFPIEYNVDTWLEKYNKEFSTQRNALTMLVQLSKKDIIAHTFQMSSAMSSAAATLATSATSASSQTATSLMAVGGGLATGGSSNDLTTSSNNVNSLKRQASVRKMLTLSTKRKTFTVNFKLQIDSLFDSIRRTRCNFLFCLVPKHNQVNKQDQHEHPSVLSDLDMFNQQLDVPLMRQQLKAYQLLAACRIYRQGYPEFMNFEEFGRRFSMFLTIAPEPTNNPQQDDHRQTCLNLIKAFDLDQTQFKMGTSQIFFKAGILAKLEDQRDDKINDLVIKLQANCKRYLAIMSFKRRKTHDSAIRCIQKNIRISFALKEWKWWRLYTNLRPILNVQANESTIKQYKDELDELKRKNERLLNEKNELKLLNNQLEHKLMNLQTDYVEEHAANAGTIDILQVETSERMRLERELNELRPLYNQTVKKLESFETEMLELRLYNTKKSIEEELEKDDIDGLSSTTNNNPTSISSSASINLKLKKENEMLKKQVKQDKENAQVLNQTERSFFESKLKEKDTELLELEKQTALHKRKYQKVCEEMQDLQRMCDESKARNRELEKQQLKFDSDLNVWRHKYESERDAHEKCQRERDQNKYELYALRSELDAQKLQVTYHLDKCERLEKDLKEYEQQAASSLSAGNADSLKSSSEQLKSTDQFMKMKSQIREMESKIRDQEEELDEQTGTIQQLEQNKLRLEMQLEREKQKWQRELAEKETEIDDIKFHTQKKIKAIEMQLEEESEINNGLQREKRELDRKLRELSANSNGLSSKKTGNLNAGDMLINDYVNKLRKQMLKYKTLAVDAQTQLEKLKQNIPKQSIMRALKSQLEDSEITKANALKTKQLLQVEINNLQEQLEDANMHRQSVEEQNIHLNREVANLRSLLDEEERETEEIMKKYQNHMQNFSFDSMRFIDLNSQVDMVTIENRILKQKIRELEDKIGSYEASYCDKMCLNKIESKNRDLECKLDLEQTHKQRLQNQLDRVKQLYEKCLNDLDQMISREKKSEEHLKKVQKQNREEMEEVGELKKKIIDLEETKKRLEQQNEILEREIEMSKGEIKVSQNRLETFQNAFNLINHHEDDDEDDDDDDDDEVDNEDEEDNENGYEEEDEQEEYLNEEIISVK